MKTSYMQANIDAFLQQFQHLHIQLEEIKSATNNFDDDKCIGGGGFGKVYIGEVSHSKGRSTAAIKRLDRRYGQGTPEFLKEITMLYHYRHENLISLLGFCYQGDEMIIVYEHASHGSLDRQLNSRDLTWPQRLKICIDAAKGLSYLHDPKETHQRLIHCDMKSANILLDDQWNAKVSDFGLSIMGPANEQYSVIITFAAGTLGYCDPQYAMMHTLTKESDVYSFGVVLFEVLCGTLCITGDVEKNLVPTWIKSYEEKKLPDIIFKSPAIEPLEQSALEIFSDIAYRCLKESRGDRPELAEVVAELESALESQEFHESQKLQENQEFKREWNKQRSYYEKISKTAEPPLNYRSEVELMKLFSKGVLLNGGKMWFSLNKKGEHCEMISFAECLGSKFPRTSEFNSRFPKGTISSWYKTVRSSTCKHSILVTRSHIHSEPCVQT
ncbi:putative serine/threonine-protein kinase PBL28 [Bidens hawaiensis]|uniref:putative serine/threonine-protein kinase PBL28 n=1 Tax=Bidens hawaiensis TaxID=980011 RepID=UPI00404983E2